MTEEEFTRLSAYLDGELDEKERQRVAAWLQKSAPARQALEDLARMNETLQGPAMEDPGELYWRSFAERVQQRIVPHSVSQQRSDPSASAERPNWFSRTLPMHGGAWPRMLATAAVLVVVFWIGNEAFRDPRVSESRSPKAELTPLEAPQRAKVEGQAAPRQEPAAQEALGNVSPQSSGLASDQRADATLRKMQKESVQAPSAPVERSVRAALMDALNISPPEQLLDSMVVAFTEALLRSDLPSADATVGELERRALEAGGAPQRLQAERMRLVLAAWPSAFHEWDALLWPRRESPLVRPVAVRWFLLQQQDERITEDPVLQRWQAWLAQVPLNNGR